VVPGTDLVVPGKGKKGKGQVLPPDLISQAAYNIEKLNAEQAMKMADVLMDGTEFSTFQLGGVFSVVNSKKYFADYGHADFKSWVENAFGIKYRKAMYLQQIYEQVLELNLTWAKIKHLGWTKLKTLLSPNLNLITADNLDEWVKKAEMMTVLQLENAVSAKKSGNDTAIEQDGNPTTKVSFALHADQKETIRAALEKAKEISGTGSDTVALEMIATDFLGKPAPVQSSATPASTGAFVIDLPGPITDSQMEALEIFEKAFPDIELEVKIPQAG
jgi:hypothetical protein